ncbi:sugar ABC transporter ATP-binding protein [Horticoccus luteus]|uniref:Sugar ABC transporter ATP-binding protein n=1 Tax=Horticoccus luteus TaxID=2862869 RepID=A0A8F9XLL2_9BACT|nr:sugar ABC transporter ATP-binding protein [Horticoccus luteus]QYM79149.1 sugar ABC transporter ATP-binding protein [Horticoccus luteus]
MASAAFVQFRAVTKTFGGVTALADVSLALNRGECHGLMGENGAGKSTLGKILAGIHPPDSGEVLIDGHSHRFHSPRHALQAGVAMVHQELAFCPDLSVAENLSLGRYPRRAAGLLLDHAAMHQRAEKLLAAIGVHLDVSRPMRELSTAQEQLVQIAAAIGTHPRILVFDEPTSSLSATDAESLFVLIEDLKKRGLTIIYVSHRMPELFRLCDRLSVLRDGRYVGTLAQAEMTHDAVVQLMIGRRLTDYFPAHVNAPAGPLVLSVRDLASPGKFQNVSFDVRAGEIVGFAGLVGSGRSEIAQAIFGLDRRATGRLTLDGQPLPLGSVTASLAAGLGLVPEDRKRQGCVLALPCRANISLAILDRLRRLGGLLDRAREKAVATDYFSRLHIKAASLDAPVNSLSGGNQQKIVIAKWLARGGRLLIVDEPTRGVDVGAKAAIHELIDELAREGLAVMLISSELPEVINLSSRVLVMRDGRLVGELTRAAATQDSVLRLMTGVARAA